jgi:hypothetical protein
MEVVAAVATREGCTPAQALLLWNIQRGVTTIPKPDNLEQLKENIATLQIPVKLSQASIDELLSLSDPERSILDAFGTAVQYFKPEMIVLSPSAQAAVSRNEALQIADSAAKGVKITKPAPGPMLPPDFLADGPDATILSEPHGRVSGFHLFVSYRVWCEKETAERLYLMADDKRLAVSPHGQPIRKYIQTQATQHIFH